jgi:hypothetical protein
MRVISKTAPIASHKRGSVKQDKTRFRLDVMVEKTCFCRTSKVSQKKKSSPKLLVFSAAPPTDVMV